MRYRPYSRSPPSLYALMDWWDKTDVTSFFLGKTSGKNLPIQEIVVEFVYFRQRKKKNGFFFILEDDNGKFWVELSGRCYFSECSSDCRCVLTESNNDVKLVET